MKSEPLSHCPTRAEAAVLRIDFSTRTHGSTSSASMQSMAPTAAAAPGLLARMRAALLGVFTRDRDTADHRCHCDVEARLLELETHKLNAQLLGNPRD
jgi:hypothetical protein